MAELDLEAAYILDSEVGHFVSEDHRRVAEIINEWDPTVELLWIPVDQRAHNEEFPFALRHSPPDRPPYIIRKLRESEVNANLIAWLWSNDMGRDPHAVQQRIDALYNAQEALKLKKQMERREADNDLALSILKGKNWYRHNGVVYS